MKASAPGKVLLLGEHAVVYGHHALAAALEKRVTVIVDEDPRHTSIELPGIPAPPELLRAVREIAAQIGAPSHFRVRVETEVPLGGGLGSSAALGVALARSLSLLARQDCPPERAEKLALHLEKVFHGAPSGVDPAVCARGGVILFRRGDPPEVKHVTLKSPLHLAVALTGIARGTRSTVLPLSARRTERPALYDPLLATLGDLARGGAEALANGDLTDLGVRFDAAHGLLSALGVSCRELDDAVAAMRRAGALGAKLTGAGGGGAAIGLAHDRGHAAALVSAIEHAGLRGFAAEIVP